MGPDAQAVIHDMETDINMPFVLNIDKSGMLDLVAKTVMRKKDFKTSNPKLNVRQCIFGKSQSQESECPNRVYAGTNC